MSATPVGSSTMERPVVYCGNDKALVVRFYNNFKFLTKTDIGEHDKYTIEQLGDKLKWPSEQLPRKIATLFKDPRFLTLFIGCIAMYSDSLLFFPFETYDWTVWAIAFLPAITLYRAQIIGWGSTMYEIGATVTRAFGRAINKPLCDEFWGISGEGTGGQLPAMPEVESDDE